MQARASQPDPMTEEETGDPKKRSLDPELD
jgi:hypothetical protein